LLNLASVYVGVKESGPNRGELVEEFQKAVDGVAQGEPWCAAFVCWLIKRVEDIYSIKSQFAFSEAVWEIWKRNKAKKVILVPKPGCFVCFARPGGGHIEVVEKVERSVPMKGAFVLHTIGGNTSSGEAGSQADGDGVYRRTRVIIDGKLGSFSLLGFIDPWK
jgi:hypothetical protein